MTRLIFKSGLLFLVCRYPKVRRWFRAGAANILIGGVVARLVCFGIGASRRKR
ncbi:MAG: hypothetical protein HFI64_06740 [Lachnospiraceae bacterium]|nr:hypothetical protein [Lachnospiraceae bacterium]